MEPLAAVTEFSRGLGASQQEKGDHRPAPGIQVPPSVHSVAPAGDAHPFGPRREPLLRELTQRPMNRPLRHLHDRLTGGFLIAGLNQRVDGEGIQLRGRLLFFKQRSENSQLGRIQRTGNLLHLPSLSERLRRTLPPPRA